MSIREFKESVTKLQIEQGGTDEEVSRYVPSVLKDRGEKYIAKLYKKYPHSLVQKAQEFYEGLSPMEQMEFAEHFEKILPAAIEANPERFTVSEIGAIFNRDGTPKTLTPGVFDSPIRNFDRGRYEVEDVLVEEPLPAPEKVGVMIPTPEEAARMGSSQLRKFIPTQGSIDDDE